MDGFATCPYNPLHRMLKLRLQNHIVKCSKNYLTAGMKPCPFNATHIIKAGEEYRAHLQTCPDAVLIEGHRYKDNDVHGKLDQGAFHFHIPKDEDWESTVEITDDSSYMSATSSKDCSQYFNVFADYDEDDEPLQRLFFEEKKSKRLINGSALGSSDSEEAKCARGHPSTDLEESGAGEVIFHGGAGRGRLLSILASISKNSDKCAL